jgi:hypothetical protein
MSAAWAGTGWLPCVIIIAVWAALLAWQIAEHKKTTDAVKTRKIKRNIALIMLIPASTYVVMVVWLIIVLFGAF